MHGTLPVMGRCMNLRSPLTMAVLGSIAVLGSAGPSAAEVRIVDADEVRARFCREDGGRLYLVLPGLAPEERWDSLSARGYAYGYGG